MEHMQRRLARGSIERAPQRFAINGYHAPQSLGETLHEAGEAGLERLRVEQAEYSAEGIMAGNAVTQTQKLAQERLFYLPEQRHVRAILAARQHGAERDHQQFMQVVAGIVVSWAHTPAKAGDDLSQGAASALNSALRIQPSTPHHPLSYPASAKCDSPDLLLESVLHPPPRV